MLFGAAKKQQSGTHFTLDYGEQSVVVELRPNPRAKRYILRLDSKARQAVVTVPKGGTRKQAERFARDQVRWIFERLDRLEEPIPFVPNAEIPLRGISHQLVATGAARGGVKPASTDVGLQLQVSGAPEHFSRRVMDFLKKQALSDFRGRVAVHAAALEVKPGAIRLRDGKSRWGSCSSNGTLNFSWRLILAPPDVLDYLAAHEVAHLREMNHSDRFWAHVQDICPAYNTHRAWLRHQGGQLWRYG
ncbi:MAG: SprT family zinc-dependent metalloprotease [Hyphomicrobiales bacterium]